MQHNPHLAPQITLGMILSVVNMARNEDKTLNQHLTEALFAAIPFGVVVYCICWGNREIEGIYESR